MENKETEKRKYFNYYNDIYYIDVIDDCDNKHVKIPKTATYYAYKAKVVGEHKVLDPDLKIGDIVPEEDILTNSQDYMIQYYIDENVAQSKISTPENGFHVEWYDTGIEKLSVEYRDGKRKGIYKEYYSDGKPYVEKTFADGYLDGKYVDYHDNGNVWHIKIFKDKKMIKYKEFTKNGNLVKTIRK